MKKFYTLLFFGLSIFGFATWQYRLLCILIVVLIWRAKVKTVVKNRCGYSLIIGCLLAGIWVAVPNYWQRGRTQLIYLDDNGSESKVPLHIYALNTLFPEEEVMNFGMKTVAVLPPVRMNVMGHHLGGGLVADAQRDFWTMKGIGFYTPYNRLMLTGSNPGTFTIAQAWNELAGDRLNAIYITKSKGYNNDKCYPVVFISKELSLNNEDVSPIGESLPERYEEKSL